MKVWLNSKKPKSKNWIWAKTPKEAARLIETGRVKKVSLVYELEFCIFTGLDFLKWLKLKVFYEDITLPKLIIHRSARAGRDEMEQEIRRIKRLKRFG